MVNLLQKIEELLLDKIPGIQVSNQPEKLSVGDIEALVILTISKYEAGLFNKASVGGTLTININLYTRSNRQYFWYEMAQKITRVLTGQQIMDGYTELEFQSLAFLGMRDNLFQGIITFTTRNYLGVV